MKSLICINTYKSVALVKSFIWDYIEFVKSNDEYSFVVSLDGKDSATIEYCKSHNIPLVYSESNEGVGISKNRIIDSFGEYEYYFFIEDDIELLNPEVFDIHIQLSKALDLHHFSLFEERRIREQRGSLEHNGYHIIQAMYGGAPFNFFTKKGLDRVGGFHTKFAKYKRFGHTEHSYRFVHNELSPSPFLIIEELLEGYFRWNDPISRIKISVEVSKNRLFIEEERLIEEKIKFFPLQTLSPYYKSNIEQMQTLEGVIIDPNIKRHKQKFYLQQFFLDSFRKIKNSIKFILKKPFAL